MAEAPQLPELPQAKPLPVGEVAKPENFYLLGRQASRSSPYADALLPTDPILVSKGGIENLKIYKELLRDDQVAATWQQRRYAVTSCEWMVEPGAEDATSVAAAEALKADLARLAWDDITDKMMYAAFFGWGVAEILWKPFEGRVTFDRIIVRDRARFRFGYSGALWLNTFRGLELMPDRKFWTISTGADNNDEPYGLGLAHALYWPVFFKRNDIKFWLTFLERFGQPTALAKVPAGTLDDAVLKSKVVSMLQAISTDAGVVVPDTVVVELLEATRGGTADYAGLCEKMDGAIAKIILSQTMTTDDGASLSQSKTHKSVRDEVVKADADLVNETFMRGPATWWTEYNFPGAATPKVYRDIKPPEDLNARAERDAKVFGLGYEPTDDYIKETYGEGWEKKKAPEPMPGMMPGRPGVPGQPGNEPNFAEGEPAALQALRIGRRADQTSMVEAARSFAEQYETITGARVAAILQAAEDSGDYESFRDQLDELLAEEPPASTMNKITNASFFSRLLGAMRGAR